jgi:hypothetical protein
MWTNYISDKKQWLAIFGNSYAPADLNISHAILRDNAITLKLFSRLEGNSYPDKWIKNEYNEYSFDLIINNVTALEIRNFNLYGQLELQINKKNSDFEITATINSACNFKCSASGIFISNIKAYNNDGAI